MDNIGKIFSKFHLIFNSLFALFLLPSSNRVTLYYAGIPLIMRGPALSFSMANTITIELDYSSITLTVGNIFEWNIQYCIHIYIPIILSGSSNPVTTSIPFRPTLSARSVCLYIYTNSNFKFSFI